MKTAALQFLLVTQALQSLQHIFTRVLPPARRECDRFTGQDFQRC